MARSDADHLEVVRKALRKLEYMPGFPETEEAFLHFSEAYARFASSEKTSHARIGKDFVPIEWLVLVITDACEFMPKPIQARKVYCRYLPPRDKREPGGLEAMVAFDNE